MRYMFVDCPDPQHAKLRKGHNSKATARAHVTKEYHRRVRETQIEAHQRQYTQARRVLVRTTSAPPAMNVVSEEEATGNDTTDSSSSSSGSDRALQRRASSASAELISTMLSQNRADPFDCLSFNLPRHMQRVLDHALTHTWPATIPIKGKPLDNPINAAWLQTCMAYPVVFHAFLYAASLHLSVASNGRQDSETDTRLSLAHYSQAIRLVHKHVANLEGPPPDALIMAVTTLAVHGRKDNRELRACHPKSPLAEQQYLHVYGQILMAPEHVPALISLIESKGGIEAVTTFGMADTIQLADIYISSLHFKKPAFDLLAEPRPLAQTRSWQMDSVAQALHVQLLSGLIPLRVHDSGSALLKALYWMRETVVALDHYSRGTNGAPDLVEIIPIRNAAQHKVLSLEISILSADSRDESAAYVSRVACLIFSDMVVFPQPEAQGVKVRRAIDLREALEHHFEQFDLIRYSQVLIWATVLGAIATSFTPGQIWFLRRLRWQLSELGIEEWPDLLDICSQMLWWKPVCDEPGRRIWDEMLSCVQPASVCGDG